MVHIKFMEGFLEYNNILLGMSKTIISSRGRQYTVRYQETARNFRKSFLFGFLLYRIRAFLKMTYTLLHKK